MTQDQRAAWRRKYRERADLGYNYYANNKDKRRDYIKKNKERIRAHGQVYRATRRTHLRNLHKQWRKNNPERNLLHRLKYDRKRAAHDINFRLRLRLRNRVYQAMRGLDRASSTVKLLGCSLEDFKLYIESKFEIGMNWDNYGSYWHLDHIIPCALFDLSKPDHQKRCFHFSNLQPLTALDNRKKMTKTDGQLRLI